MKILLNDKDEASINNASAEVKAIAKDILPEVKKDIRNIGADTILLMKVLLNLQLTTREKRSLADNNTPKLSKLMNDLKNYPTTVVKAIKYLPLEVLLYVVRGANEYEQIENKYLDYKAKEIVSNMKNPPNKLQFLYNINESSPNVNSEVITNAIRQKLAKMNNSSSFNKLRPMFNMNNNQKLEELIIKTNIKNLLLQLNFAEKLYGIVGNERMYKRIRKIKKILSMLSVKKSN